VLVVIGPLSASAAGVSSDGIKADCVAEWSGNYRMQKHCMKQQTEAGRALAPIFKSATGERRRILDQCASEWTTPNGFNLRMVKHCYDQQIEAYEDLNPPEVPKATVAVDWCHPNDNTARILASMNPNDIHAGWKGESYVGTSWAVKPASRLIKTPKLHFLDSGLLATLREDEAGILQDDRTRFGALLESFVVSELLKLASWSERRLSFSHYRTKDQDEVDIVIEDRRGRIIGIEVKASATVRPQDFRGLRQLQDAVGDRFVRGLVLHDHDRVTPFGEKLQAAPLSVLWSM
jgi:hypothetical protein